MEADYKHGLHFTALPTAWVSGFDKTTELRIGSSTAWVADSVGAVAGFLEFRGHGLIHFLRGVIRKGRGFLKGGLPLPGPLPRFMAERGKTAEAIELRQPGGVWPYSLSGRDEALKKKRGTK